MKEKIRKAKQKDIPRILQLLNSDPGLIDNNSIKYTQKLIVVYLKEPSDFIFAFEAEKKIVGIITGCIFKKEYHLNLYHLIVDEKYRKRGISKSLIKYVEKLAKKHNIKLIYFYTEVNNKLMQKTAEKWGYKRGEKMYFFSKKFK